MVYGEAKDLTRQSMAGQGVAKALRFSRKSEEETGGQPVFFLR
jgi:hypothetical protein